MYSSRVRGSSHSGSAGGSKGLPGSAEQIEVTGIKRFHQQAFEPTVDVTKHLLFGTVLNSEFLVAARPGQEFEQNQSFIV